MSDVFYEDSQIHCEVVGPELKSDTNSESENDEDEYEDEDLQGYVDFPNERRKNGLSRLLEVFPDVDSGFLQDKNVEFDGDLSKINDWIQEVFEKDLARNFPPKVSACGARIVCQKCKIDMNEIFKSSKKHACELELVKD